jgi:lipoprotein-anchoring transpeptidase ErfK/SrfK
VLPEGLYTVYRREHNSRRRWPYFVVAAVCVVVVLAAWQLVGVPRVSAITPGPGTFIRYASPAIVLDVHGLAKLTDVRVTLDGRDATNLSSRDGDKLTVATGKLTDGPHTVSFSAASGNLFRHRVQRTWRFTVDTRLPTLKLNGSVNGGRINTSPATFSGTTEAFSTVTVTSGSVKASGQADASGNYSVSARLPDGPSQVTVSTIDRAGNRTVRQMQVYVDAIPPVLKTTQLGKTVRHPGIKIHISGSDQLAAPKVRLLLDGDPRAFTGTAAHGVFLAKNLAQGTHKLVITAADRGGNVVTHKQTFVIDSTERFGSAAMWLGARGKDVRALQKRLAAAGVFSGATSNVYDARTTTAVKKFQAKYGLTADGLVGNEALNALAGQIIVDLSSLRLYLYRGDKLVKSYPVATGQPAWPTPTGTYAIVDKTMNPTWLPPNSDWAKNAQKIPPGTENPLGTRWMGTSASGVGIHGVPPSEDGSIGSYASHGCIRMHNSDAVDLFDRVVVGMPVIIRR